MSGCDLISKYIVHILKPGASKIHKTHFMSDLSSLFPFLMSRIYILFVTYLLHNISRLQFRVKNKISPLDKQSLIVFLQTFNFIYSFIVLLTCSRQRGTQHSPPASLDLLTWIGEKISGLKLVDFLSSSLGYAEQ